METTTIQVSVELKKKLSEMKISDRETFENVIWDILEDRAVLSKETLREIEQARQEFREEKGVPWSEVEKSLKKR